MRYKIRLDRYKKQATAQNHLDLFFIHYTGLTFYDVFLIPKAVRGGMLHLSDDKISLV